MARNEGAVNRVLRVIVGPSDALARIHRPAEAVGVARSRAVDHRICWVLLGFVRFILCLASAPVPRQRLNDRHRGHAPRRSRRHGALGRLVFHARD